MANLKYIGKNILNHELEVKSGNIIGDHTEVIRVTVVSDGGNKYAFEGATTPDLTIDEGKTYRFDQSDSTNDTHPLRFSIVKSGVVVPSNAYLLPPSETTVTLITSVWSPITLPFFTSSSWFNIFLPIYFRFAILCYFQYTRKSL